MATYWEVAEEDDSACHVMYDNKQYRHAMIIAQQAGEKYVKHILEQISPKSPALHWHKIEKILDSISDDIPDDVYASATRLSSCYIDLRYPGDNYIETITNHQAERALKNLKTVRDYCESIHFESLPEENKLKNEPMSDVLECLKETE